MHTDKIWIVIIILIAVLAGSNLVMYAAVRGFRDVRIDWSKDSNSLSTPFRKQDEKLKELSQRVKDLKANNNEED